MDDQLDAEIEARVLHHFAQNPNASDTAEGVRRWWMPDLACLGEDVERVLESLVASGSLTSRRLADGSVVYARRA